MAIFFFIIGLIFFVGLVVFHEFGHYIAARRNDVEVEEFGIGFPPRAKILAKRKGTIYSLNWLPLGGFVKLKGEHDQDTEKGSFGAAKMWPKTKIMLAGVAMNLLAALVLFTVVALLGMPKLLDNQFTVASDTKVVQQVQDKDVIKIDYVVDNSPAATAGLKADDQILRVDGNSIKSTSDLTDATKSNAGKQVSVETSRDGQSKVQLITLSKTSPYLGVAPYSGAHGLEVRRSTWSAPIVAVGVSKDFTVATFKGLGTALKGLGSTFAGLFTGNKLARQNGQTQASSQVSGPVGIFTVLYEISKQGFGLVLFVIALISLTLAIMNALPIPALDGGRLFVMLLYHVRHKELRPEVEERIHGTGFAVLMLLFIVITVVDVRRFF